MNKSILKVFISVILVLSLIPVNTVFATELMTKNIVNDTGSKITGELQEILDSLPDSSQDEIPVWVWLTDIDMLELEKNIEEQTGLTQQELNIAKMSINNDISTSNINSGARANNITSVSDNSISLFESTKMQKEELAKNTELYLSTKKSLACSRYNIENSAKISKLGIEEDKIDFFSELTPSFIAFLTKYEIEETVKSDDVLEIGYFSEYDEEYIEEPFQTDSQSRSTSISDISSPDISNLHLGIKEDIRYDQAMQEYDVTGDGIKVLHIDHDFVRNDYDNFNFIPFPNKIKNIKEGSIYSVTDVANIPSKKSNHANHCVAYLQTFAKDVNIFSVPIPSYYYSNNMPNINPYDDVEYAITDIGIDLIDASCNQSSYSYSNSFASKWHDAIVYKYNIPIIASAGNGINSFPKPIAPANGYNSIAVGVYFCDTNKMLDNYTYNPINETDRVAYKPDLVVAMDNYNGAFGATSCGAPVVSGIVAMMMELEPSLKGNPEIVKAILMASCQEKAVRSNADATSGIAQEMMEDGLTLKQGAGKVDVFRALRIISCGTYGYDILQPERNGLVSERLYLNSEVSSNNVIYPLNVSSVWLRRNIKNSNQQSGDAITLGDYYELNLRASYTNQDQNEVKISEVNNAAKQMIYYPNPVLDKEYDVRIYWDSTNVNDRGIALYGYAYSVGDLDKVLEELELIGHTAIGQTLSVNAYTADAALAEMAPLSYEWYSSTDGESWQIISGATSSTFTVTNNELNKYVKCNISQNYLQGFEIETITDTYVVQYGDVNLDGTVSVFDATVIRLYLDNQITLTKEQMLAADVNGDGEITDSDALEIQNYIAGLITSFPVEN